MTKSTVRAFLALLTSKITQADAAAEKRARAKRQFFNIHSMPIMFQAVDRVKAQVLDVLDSDAPDALTRLRKAIAEAFTDVAPVRATLKQLDQCIATGRKPHLLRGETKKLHFAGYDFESGPGGTTIARQLVDVNSPGDHGCDPQPDGTFRMVPSGDVVDAAEKNRRLKR